MFIQRFSKFSIKLCERHLIRNNNTSFRHINQSAHVKAMMDAEFSKPSIKLGNQELEKLIRVNNIVKSQQDCREYRGLLLENGIKVLLVSDPATDVSAAALSVEVGHMSDPDPLPGLAHFCEHMLFLGTEKYPNENAYSTYLSQNGGSSNAATYSNMTKYYFDVAPDKLDGALDRFAQFFIAPLFTESATDREINAVNSEHEKNLAIDIWRIRQVNKHLANKNHPYSKFGSGNKQTLEVIPKQENINVREELMKFHKQWYSANIMCLAIFGKETLNELENMVVSKFVNVENKSVNLPTWHHEPYPPEQYATKVFISPVKDIRSLSISFTTEDLDKYNKSGPEQYLSHLIGHEGKGSILSELRKRGWCNDLMAGHSNTSRGFGFFDISVDLTQDGFEHIDEIIHLIFQYIALLREEGPKKWIFEEYCSLNEMIFRFKDKENPISLVTNVVHSMQIYPLEEVLTAPYLTSEWRPDIIKKLLDQFVPEKCRIIIVGKKLEAITNETEPWYKTKFHHKKIDTTTIEKWKTCTLNDQLKLPEPNPFIPTDFNILPEDSDLSKHPIIIHDSPIIRVWHKQDTEFVKPKTFMNFDFSNPIVYSDPLNCNLTHMLVALFRDHLNEYLYDADLAGLKFGVANKTSGISVAISGYSHKQKILLEKVLDQLFDFKIDNQRFEILKEEYIRALKNFQAEQPYQHAVYYLALILTENAWSKTELLDAMQLVTKEKLEQFIDDFLSRLHTECFIYGNVNKQKALEMSDIVKTKLETTNSVILPLLARQLLQKREYKLSDGDSFLFETVNEYHKSSCSELYVQCGIQNDTSVVFVDLVAQILTEPCYNSLRTKEQLGYIVFCGSRKVNGATGIRIIVQSAKHPTYVEERIETFLENMLTQIESMSDEEFNRHKEALTSQKLEKPKKLSVMFNKYLTEISLAQYHFERAEAEVAILKRITKTELLNYFKTFITKSSPARHVLSVHIVSTADVSSPDPNENEIVSNNENIVIPDNTLETIITPSNHIKITELSTFKSSKELYPVARPFLDIRPKGARSKL